MTAHSSRASIAIEPLIAEAKGRMRRRRSLVVILVAFAGLAVGLTFVLRSTSGGPGVPRPLTGSLRAGELRVSVPPGLRSYDVPVGRGVRTPVVGHLLTDFRIPARVDIWKVLGHWALAGPAANGVALKLQRWVYRGILPLGRNQLHLPLNLKQPWAVEKFNDGRVGYRWGYLRFRGAWYQVMYWSGPTAPAADRAAVLRALSSIRPAR